MCTENKMLLHSKMYVLMPNFQFPHSTKAILRNIVLLYYITWHIKYLRHCKEKYKEECVKYMSGVTSYFKRHYPK